MPSNSGNQNVSPCTLMTGQRHTVVVPRYQGRLFWMTDVPIVNTEISLLDADGVKLATSQTNEHGDFSFDLGFPTGCQVTCQTVESNDTTLFARLFIHDLSTPLANTEVRFTEFGEPRSATTNDAGELRVEGLTDHFYRLTVAGETVRVMTLTAEEVAAGHEPEQVIISVKAAALGSEAEGFDTFDLPEEEQEFEAYALALDESDDGET